MEREGSQTVVDPWAGTLAQRAGSLYCAEQVNVPHNLHDILRIWTKDVIKAKPDDVLAYSAKWFEERTQAK